MKKIAFLILTHNAPKYVKLTIDSVYKHTKDIDFEIIVLDNDSKWQTKALLKLLFLRKKIDKLVFSSHNTLFGGGNNIMAHLTDDADLFLLLNSDIEVKDDNWLKNLLEHHKKGVTAYGVIEHEPVRVDGWCYLIDAELYRQNPLSREHQWWWAITKQQADILNQGYDVQGFQDYEKWIHHFGGKSGGDFKGAKGMATPVETSKGWFKGKNITILDR